MFYDERDDLVKFNFRENYKKIWEPNKNTDEAGKFIRIILNFFINNNKIKTKLRIDIKII